MQQIEISVGLDGALDSILGRRLAVLAGAGVSMVPPSNLQAAAAIASGAKLKYDRTHGKSRPALVEGIEEQAEYFFQRREIASVYFRTLVDPNIFAAPPNDGGTG